MSAKIFLINRVAVQTRKLNLKIQAQQNTPEVYTSLRI